MVDVDAQDGGCFLILGDAPHGTAQPGPLGEEVQRRADQGTDDDGEDGGVFQGDTSQIHTAGGKDLAGDLGVWSDGGDSLGQVFQKQAHGNGGDQGGHVGAFLAHRAVGDELCAHAHQGAYRDGGQHGGPGRQSQAQHQRNGKDHGVAAHHDEIAVGEVDEADDAVYHGVAQGDQGVNAAQAQPHDQGLDKCTHWGSPFSS